MKFKPSTFKYLTVGHSKDTSLFTPSNLLILFKIEEISILAYDNGKFRNSNVYDKNTFVKWSFDI